MCSSDLACALARFENGTTAFFEVSRLHAASHVHSEIIGTQGVIRVNDIPDISRLEQFDGRGYVRTCEHTFLDRWAEAYRLELADFVRCIETGCPSSICVYDGAKSLRMVNMMQAAYEKDAVVTDGG